MAEDRADDIVEVMRDTAGESTDRFHATSLLEIRLQASTFLQQMIPHHDIGDGVESHAQQAEFSRLRDNARPHREQRHEGSGSLCPRHHCFCSDSLFISDCSSGRGR